jgi:hypothetical protein
MSMTITEAMAEIRMKCTRCGQPILRGRQKYHRTKRGPHHATCPRHNNAFDKAVLRHLGLPDDYIPRDENEAYRLVVAALED